MLPYNDGMSQPKVDQINKRVNRGYISFALAFATMSVLIVLSGVRISSFYLHKAEKSARSEEHLLYLSLSDAFWRTEDSQYKLGQYYLKQKDYVRAAVYFSGNNAISAKNAYVEAKYYVSDYQSVVSRYMGEPTLYAEPSRILVAKSYLKLGDLNEARKLLSQLPEAGLSIGEKSILAVEDEEMNYQLVYKALNTEGFPHAATELLREGETKKHLDRDALLSLAQAEIYESHKDRAYETLIQALAKDAYYPQTYRQLITTGGELGKDVSVYKNRLAELEW